MFQINKDRVEVLFVRQAAQGFPHQTGLAHAPRSREQGVGAFSCPLGKRLQLSLPVEETVPVNPVRSRLDQGHNDLPAKLLQTVLLAKIGTGGEIVKPRKSYRRMADRQVNALLAATIDWPDLFAEKASGVSSDRSGLAAALNDVCAG